jgi:hypothetical protein
MSGAEMIRNQRRREARNPAVPDKRRQTPAPNHHESLNNIPRSPWPPLGMPAQSPARAEASLLQTRASCVAAVELLDRKKAQNGENLLHPCYTN